MRHIGSLALALFVTPVAWVLTGIGLAAYAGSGPDTGPTRALVLGLLAPLGAGALLALLVLPRTSPTGPVVAGLLLLGMTAWATVDLGSLRRALPDELFGLDLGLPLPAGGIAAVLAVPLIATGLSPRRWRGSERLPAPAPAPGPPPPVSYSPSVHPVPTDGSATLHLPPGPAAGTPGFTPRSGPTAGFVPPAAGAAPSAGFAPSVAPLADRPATAPATAAPGGVPPLRAAGREPDTDDTTRLSPPAPRPAPPTSPVPAPAFAGPDHPTSDLRTPAQPDFEATMVLRPAPPEPDTAAVAAPAHPSSAVDDGEATTVLRPPADEEPTAATKSAPPAGTPGPGRATTTDEATQRIGGATGPVDEATEQIDEVTARLRGTPPPPAAYPPPGHSTPTAAPVDPDATRRL